MQNKIIALMNQIQAIAYECSVNDDCEWHLFCDYAGHVNLFTVRAYEKLDMDDGDYVRYEVWLNNDRPVQRLSDLLSDVLSLTSVEV